MNMLIREQISNPDQCRPSVAGTAAVGKAFRNAAYSIEMPSENLYSSRHHLRHPLIYCDGFWEPSQKLPWDRPAVYGKCELRDEAPPHFYVYDHDEPLPPGLPAEARVVQLPAGYMDAVRDGRSRCHNAQSIGSVAREVGIDMSF